MFAATCEKGVLVEAEEGSMIGGLCNAVAETVVAVLDAYICEISDIVEAARAVMQTKAAEVRS